MGRPTPRVRYNAKARGSVAGGSGKRGKPQKDRSTEAGGNSTAVDIVDGAYDLDTVMMMPAGEGTKKIDSSDEVKARMKAELVAASDTKMSSKKKRKLDAYIDKKLKKEERVVLFKKLAESQGQVSSLVLHSSSALGSGKLETNAARLAKNEDKNVRHALARSVDGPRRKRRKIVSANSIAIAPPEDSTSDNSDEEQNHDSNMNVASIAHSEITSPPALPHRILPRSPELSKAGELRPAEPLKSSTVIGGALARNPDGTVIAPRAVARKRKKKFGQTVSIRGLPSNLDSGDEEGSMSPAANGSSSGSDNDNDNDDDASDSESEVVSQQSPSDSEEASDNESGADGASINTKKRKRGGGFKEWAQRQINLAKGFSEMHDPYSEDLLSSTISKAKTKPTVPDGPQTLRGPLGEDYRLPSTSFAAALVPSASPNTSEPATTSKSASPAKNHISVQRTEEIQAARLLLPVTSEEQNIVEAIRLNPVVVICGETGSGKTTQVPQFLFEAGFGSPGSDNPGMIGITQPRRVAAMSMASRVATELSLPPSRVSYQIRYDATVSPSTSIKFMTDGVLLRELATDFLLSKYSVIIVDEAHERSMNTDILIGVLSRVLKVREDLWKKKSGDTKPLRLIIMSATLRVSDFAENKTLFSTVPPIINISARQHPVTIHFNRRTPSDYVPEAVRKAVKIHARLPAGGILIFMTGQNEITTVCRKLESKFGKKTLENKKTRVTRSGKVLEIPAVQVEESHVIQGPGGDAEIEEMGIDIDPLDIEQGVDGNDAVDPDAFDSEDENDADGTIGLDHSDVPMHVVPLYSLLSSEQQMKVFQPPPEGSRLVVVATNVAETSLTIPGIRYVIDCGRAKEREHDTQSGIQNFKIAWISKASASQRAGRAGRTGPGHCYRLYSSALFEHHFSQFSQPEILRVPIEGVVLQMKSMHIDAVANFPFPTPPDRVALKKAETILTRLGALDFSKSDEHDKGEGNLVQRASSGLTIGGHITELGTAMALFPVSPRFSKMLVAGRQHGTLPYVIAIVAALSVGNPFLHEDFLHSEDSEISGANTVDLADEEAPAELSYIKSADLRAKELRKLERRKFFKSQQMHAQLGNGISDVFRTLSVVGAYEFAGGGASFCAEHFVRRKAMEEIHKLRAQISSIVRSNFPEADVQFSPTLPPPSSKQLKVLRQLLTSGFIDHVAVRKDLVVKDPDGTKYAASRGVAYQALNVEEDVFIHPSSLLFHSTPPDYVVYQEVVRTSKVWIKTVTVINPSWLPTLGPSLCTFSKPKDLPAAMKGAGTVVIPRFADKFNLPPMRI